MFGQGIEIYLQSSGSSHLAPIPYSTSDVALERGPRDSAIYNPVGTREDRGPELVQAAIGADLLVSPRELSGPVICGFRASGGGDGPFDRTD